MKKLHFIGIMLLVLFILPGYNMIATNANTETSIDLKAYDLGSDTITIDGDTSDWANIESEHFELTDPLDATDTTTYEAKLRVAYDDKDIYFLVEIEEKFQLYNITKAQEDAKNGGKIHNRQIVALALAFSINGTGSSRHMGSQSSTSINSVGFADIMHWEVETDPGVVNTGSKGTEGKMGNGPTNLDDEYSSSTIGGFRQDDKVDQAWTGAWDHTAKTNGSLGTYIFELKRPLTNDDELDAQFEMNKRNEITIAFWTPFETAEGWTEQGHYTSSEIEGYFILGNLPATPIDGFIIGLIVLIVAIPIFSKKYIGSIVSRM